MSKAFTRESDRDAEEESALARLPSPLPPGAKNYMTPAGVTRLREELGDLVEARRTRAAEAESSGEGAPANALADQRILYLQESLSSAVIVEPPPPPWTQVRFGATATVRDPSGALERYRVVGVDEADFDRGWISWLSPLARALVNASVGQEVRFRVPSGERTLAVVSVTYE